MFARPLLAVGAALLVAFALPAATAWTVTEPAEPLPPNVAAWTMFGRPLFAQPGDVAGTVVRAATCALGDVNADGLGDIAVHAKTNVSASASSAAASIQALAGPDFTTVIWEVPMAANRIMECAPDLDLDGIADPITSLATTAAGAANGAGPVASQSIDRALQFVNGANGVTFIARQAKDQVTSAGAAGAGAASSLTSSLVPAAAGAAAMVKSEVQESVLSAVPSGLPVGALTAEARHAVELQLLDAAGSLQGTIRIDEPGVDPLSLVPVPAGAGLPNVAALTAQTLSPVQQATQRVPTLSLFNPDGSLAWSVDLSATAALPILVPRVGDLNVDGVPDLVVETVQSGVQAAPTAAFQVLSGVDGKMLFGSGTPVDGLVAALPLGTVTGQATALLSVQQLKGAAKMTLKALDGAGAPLWSAEVEAGAFPINVNVDAYTGEALGFTDLTSDGLPDVGVAVQSGADLVVSAIDGASGAVAWTQTLAGVASVLPLPPVPDLGGVVGTARSMTSDLIAIGSGSAGPVLSLVQGTSGQIVWTVTGALPQGATSVEVVVEAAGDITGDGAADLLATVRAAAGKPASASPFMASSDDSPGAGGESVYAISGADGSTAYSESTDGGDAAPLAASPGPAYEAPAADASPTDDGGKSPGLGFALVATASAAAIAIMRRRP